jgi:hypothetical protein
MAVPGRHRWPNGPPGPSPVWPSPMRPGTMLARWTFVPGRVGPPCRSISPGPALMPLGPCWTGPEHGKARRPV